MFIDRDIKIKVEGESIEFIALSQKMSSVINQSNLRPSMPGTSLYFLWGYSFADALNRIIKKTVNVNNLFSESEKDLTVTFPINEAYAICLCCAPNSEDSNYLGRIYSKIFQQLPIEESKSISHLLEN